MLEWQRNITRRLQKSGVFIHVGSRPLPRQAPVPVFLPINGQVLVLKAHSQAAKLLKWTPISSKVRRRRKHLRRKRNEL